MNETLGEIRVRQDNATSQVIYVRVAPSKWMVLYFDLRSGETIEGHTTDPVATRWPIVWTPEGNLS